jgi:hypothetical protein
MLSDHTVVLRVLEVIFQPSRTIYDYFDFIYPQINYYSFNMKIFKIQLVS